jgi:hypothetical protein
MPSINRRTFLVLGAGGLAALGAGPSPQDDAGLIVHEWGVVTIPYGTKGVLVRSDGVRHGPKGEEITDLPPFVVTWKAAVGSQIEELRMRPVRKPVVYFYSKKAATLSIKVSVPGGRPDAWWPPADDFEPKSKFITPARLGGRPEQPEEIKPEKGQLLWRALTLDPSADGFANAEGWWPSLERPTPRPSAASPERTNSSSTTRSPSTTRASRSDGRKAIGCSSGRRTTNP